MNAPLLRCRDARIEVDGDVLVSGLDVEADGTKVLLVGNWEPLFRLFSSAAVVAQGSVLILGLTPREALAKNQLGLGVQEVAFAASSKALESLVSSARLAGLGKRDATKRAEAVLDELGLGVLGKSRFGMLDLAKRRALTIARAVLGDPPAIAIERPFEAVPDEDALMLEAVLGRAAARRKLLLHLAQPRQGGPDARALAMADKIVDLPGEIFAPGKPRLDSPSGKLDS